MKTTRFGFICLLLMLNLLVFSCKEEDPGPMQNDQRSYNTIDFDHISAGDAFDITVQQGIVFSITAKGDKRNLDDLRIEKAGTTLQVKYSNHHDRQYTTYLTITMPVLYGLDFSGAINGHITGFTTPVSRFDMSFSGASVGQVNINSDDVHATITGASIARLIGQGKKIDLTVTGASDFTSFEFPAETIQSVISGASHAKIAVSQLLSVNASGASDVVYRGDARLDADVSGASTVTKE